MSPAGKLVFAQLFVPEVRAGTLVRLVHDAQPGVCARPDATCTKRRRHGRAASHSCPDLSFFLVVVCIIALGFISNQRWVGRSGRRIVYRCPAVSLAISVAAVRIPRREGAAMTFRGPSTGRGLRARLFFETRRFRTGNDGIKSDGRIQRGIYGCGIFETFFRQKCRTRKATEHCKRPRPRRLVSNPHWSLSLPWLGIHK